MVLCAAALAMSATAGEKDEAAQVMAQLKKDQGNIDKEALAMHKAARERAAKKLTALRDRLAKAGRYDEAMEAHTLVKALRITCATINSGGTWYPGRVLSSKDGKYLVHYDGYGADSDEWVAPGLVVEVPCATPASSADAPSE